MVGLCERNIRRYSAVLEGLFWTFGVLSTGGVNPMKRSQIESTNVNKTTSCIFFVQNVSCRKICAKSTLCFSHVEQKKLSHLHVMCFLHRQRTKIQHSNRSNLRL